MQRWQRMHLVMSRIIAGEEIVDFSRRHTGRIEEAVLTQADELCDVLQFAIAVAHASRAILIVIGKQKFHLQALRIARARRAGLHRHPFDHRRVARCRQLRFWLARNIDFHKAYAAAAGRVVDVVEFA